MARNIAEQLINKSTAVATTPRRSSLEIKQDNLASLIKRMTPAMEAALPAHMSGERMARIATTVMRRNPSLAECNDMSFIGAIMTCAQLGLEPGPTQQAHLVVFKGECTFVIGYRGMIELARRSGQVETIYAHPVYEHDEFHVEYGLNETLSHIPYMDGDPGELRYVYAIVKYKDGGHNMTVMSRAAVDKIRDETPGWKFANKDKREKSPWATHYEAMALKTAVRQLSKWMPQSVEFQTALAIDGKVRTDTAPEALDNLAADPYEDGDIIDAEPVSSVPTSPAPAGMNPDTGEVDALWPETAQPPK